MVWKIWTNNAAVFSGGSLKYLFWCTSTESYCHPIRKRPSVKDRSTENNHCHLLKTGKILAISPVLSRLSRRCKTKPVLTPAQGQRITYISTVTIMESQIDTPAPGFQLLPWLGHILHLSVPQFPHHSKAIVTPVSLVWATDSTYLVSLMILLHAEVKNPLP